MPTEATTDFLFAVLALFIGWRVYARVRRLIGRQRSRPWRHWTAAILFPILIALLSLAGLRSAAALASLVTGVAAGIALAVWGLKLTKFEAIPEGLFYTPSAHIGIGLTLVVFGTLAAYYTTYALGLLRWRRTVRRGAGAP